MLKVNIIGIGPGNPELLTVAAQKAISDSTALIGDKRMIEPFMDNKKCFFTIKSEEIISALQSLDSVKETVSILVSGDIGFYSLAQVIAKKLKGFDVHMYAGISSLVYFAQELGQSWNDVKLISMHGRDNNLIQNVRENAKVFVLTGGDNNASVLCKKLTESGLGDVLVSVGENLSYPNQKITSDTASALQTKEFPSLAVMFIINNKANVDASFGLEDEAFTRIEKVPMTKQEVRAVIMSKMKIQQKDIVYDIGAGTGSCSIEFARLASRGKVYAFERNTEAIEAIKINKKNFALDNIEVLEGDAVDTIKDIEAPQGAFVGGSGGSLQSLLDTIYQKNANCKVVVTAVTLETLNEITCYYKDKKAYSLDIVNISVARAKKLGEYHLMMAQNPIYVATISKNEG